MRNPRAAPLPGTASIRRAATLLPWRLLLDHEIDAHLSTGCFDLNEAGEQLRLTRDLANLSPSPQPLENPGTPSSPLARRFEHSKLVSLVTTAMASSSHPTKKATAATKLENRFSDHPLLVTGRGREALDRNSLARFDKAFRFVFSDIDERKLGKGTLLLYPGGDEEHGKARWGRRYRMIPGGSGRGSIRCWPWDRS